MAIPGLPGGLIIYQGHLFPLNTYVPLPCVNSRKLPPLASVNGTKASKELLPLAFELMQVPVILVPGMFLRVSSIFKGRLTMKHNQRNI